MFWRYYFFILLIEMHQPIRLIQAFVTYVVVSHGCPQFGRTAPTCLVDQMTNTIRYYDKKSEQGS